jgi:hypothetical protein
MKDGIETPWNKGSVKLIDGTNLVGLVKYNEINALISFKEDEDSKESRTFKTTKVYSISFIDASSGKQRNFFSFDHNIDGKERVLLFEVLKEFKDWAVLARKGKVEALEGKNDTGYNNEGLPAGKNTRAVLSQAEGIYAINEDGKIELFQITSHLEVDGLLMDYSDDNSKIERDILKKYLKSYFEDVEQYAKQNKLKIKRRPDLLKALDYYETLVRSTD